MKRKQPQSEAERRAQEITKAFGEVSAEDREALQELQRRILECANRKKIA